MQLGSVVYNFSALGINTPPFANNGLSISGGVVQLGGPSGAASAAKLLNGREIPMNGFDLLFSGVGSTAAGGASKMSFQYDVAAINTIAPQIVFLGHAGAPIGAIRFGEANASVYIGVVAGTNNVGSVNVVVGAGAAMNQVTMTKCIAIGGGAMQGGVDGLNLSIAIGSDTLDNGGFAIGAQNICIGHNTFDQALAAIGVQNIAIGNFINNSVGGAIGNQNIVIGTGVNIGCSNSIIISGTPNNANFLNLSNVIILGGSTQNTILGQDLTLAYTDNGNRLQVKGKLNTGGAAPLTLGAGAMDFGKIVTAASALNATKYWETTVDGVLVKVCIN